MGEFAWNNHIHSSSQHTPFLINHGRHPRMGFEPVRPSKVEPVKDFVKNMQASWEEAKSAIIKAKDEMAKYYNRRRKPTPEFKVGDKVWLDSSDIRTSRPSRKLSDKWLGPFPVTEKVSPMAYRLKLPVSMKGIHPVFPVVKLELRSEDPITGRHPQPPPPPDIIDGEEEWEVEEIVNSRFYGRWKKFQYRVKWKGYDDSETTWQDADDVRPHAQEAILNFHRLHPEAPRQINSLSIGRLWFPQRSLPVTDPDTLMLPSEKFLELWVRRGGAPRRGGDVRDSLGLAMNRIYNAICELKGPMV